MSGHSKWATTKHKKAVIDGRRAKSFAKLIKNIEVAAKMGGADLSGNPTLVDAVQKAKKTSVPNDNIDRAIKRGAGLSGESVDYQTIMYEGYGPNGVALLIECLTDNKNRAAAEVRTLMTRNGGTMADPGSVAYNFNRKGVISITKTPSGDRRRHPARRFWMPAPKRSSTRAAASRSSPTRATWSRLAPRSWTPASTTTPPTPSSCPTCTSRSTLETARKVIKLIDALEESDDVQNIFSNYEVPADVQAILDDDD